MLKSINKCTRNHEMLRVLVLWVVDCWTCGYQLSEEALLGGIFIGNSIGRGIRHIVGGNPLNGHGVVQNTSSWCHTIRAAWLGPKKVSFAIAMCHVEKKSNETSKPQCCCDFAQLLLYDIVWLQTTHNLRECWGKSRRRRDGGATYYIPSAAVAL